MLMRLIRSLTVLTMIAVILFLAMIRLAPLAGLESPVVYLPDLIRPQNQLAFQLYWVAIGLLPVLYVAATLAIWRKRPRALRVRTGDGGMLLLQPGALFKFVRSQIEAHRAVTSQKVRVRQSGSRGISVWAQIDVQPIASLSAIRNDLEMTIRTGLANVIGVEKIDEITLIIGLDDKHLNRRPGPSMLPPPNPEPPMRSGDDDGAPRDLQRREANKDETAR